MTIRGGGNPHSAMAAMPLREWTRRLGALPAEAYDCFMVWTPYGFNRIQAWFARLIAANGRLPSDHPAANHKGRPKWRDAPLTKKAPYKPMTIRGGGNPHSAMAAMPLREWTRRLGALPAEAYDCFMVWTPYGFNRIQAWFARLIAANGRLPSDHPAANHKGRPKWRDAPLTKKAPYKPDRALAYARCQSALERDGQNRRMKLSSSKGALQKGVLIACRFTPWYHAGELGLTEMALKDYCPSIFCVAFASHTTERNFATYFWCRCRSGALDDLA